jgi:hypothetical protein
MVVGVDVHNGVDVHKRSHTVALLDGNAVVLAALTIPNSPAGAERLLGWLDEHDAPRGDRLDRECRRLRGPQRAGRAHASRSARAGAGQERPRRRSGDQTGRATQARAARPGARARADPRLVGETLRCVQVLEPASTRGFSRDDVDWG